MYCMLETNKRNTFMLKKKKNNATATSMLQDIRVLGVPRIL